MHNVILSKRAIKDLDRLPDQVGRRLYHQSMQLAGDPRPRGSVKIESEDHTYRIRTGDYRAIYEVDDKALTILVLRIVHRKDAYR